MTKRGKLLLGIIRRRRRGKGDVRNGRQSPGDRCLRGFWRCNFQPAPPEVFFEGGVGFY